MLRITHGLVIAFALFLHISSSAAYLKDKPEFLESCKISQPDAQKCILTATQSLIEQFKKGFPEALDKYGSYDPMHVDQITYLDDKNEAASLKCNLTDLTITGFNKTVVKENKLSKRDFTGRTKFHTPIVKIEGKYSMDGRLLVLPLKGNGKISLTLENLEINLITKGRFYEQDGLLFAKITSVKSSFTVSRLRSKLDNLFDGKSPEIEKSTNEFFNDSWEQFLEALRPVFEKTFDDLHFDILTKVFDLIPYKYLISDMPPLKDLPQLKR